MENSVRCTVKASYSYKLAWLACTQDQLGIPSGYTFYVQVYTTFALIWKTLKDVKQITTNPQYMPPGLSLAISCNKIQNLLISQVKDSIVLSIFQLRFHEPIHHKAGSDQGLPGLSTLNMYFDIPALLTITYMEGFDRFCTGHSSNVNL